MPRFLEGRRVWEQRLHLRYQLSLLQLMQDVNDCLHQIVVDGKKAVLVTLRGPCTAGNIQRARVVCPNIPLAMVWEARNAIFGSQQMKSPSRKD